MAVIDINKKLDSILFKNNIIKVVSLDKAIAEVKALEEKLLNYKVGLYGVGVQAEGLLYFILEHAINFKIDVCFDKTIRSYKYKNMIKNSTVYPIEDIINMDVDYLILGSFTYAKTFTENIAQIGYKGKIINLYDFLEDYIYDHFADYKMIFQTRQSYLKAVGSDKAKILHKIIKEYLMIKDFRNAFHYMDIFVANQYLGYKQYKKLKSELMDFLEEIKECISKRNKKDIIINWVDALSYYDINRFPFLSEKSKKGINFENAYTVMPWTTETTKTILFGEYPIEGKLFLKERLGKENVKLIKNLSENGYGFAYCGMAKFAKMFDESVSAPISYYENKYSGSMRKQWDALAIMCYSEMPMCILIHTLKETHEPFICGEGNTFISFRSSEKEWNRKECKIQAKISGEYINNQLEFYEKFYGENAIEIYMSDHGRVGNSPMNENKIHVMLSINGKNMHQDRIYSMFSLVKFSDLIKKIIMNENNWIDLTDNYVLIENLDAYSEQVVQDTMSGKLTSDEMLQCRGVVTLTDRYFLYRYGKEYYFKNRESKENEIDNPQYKDRIQELKTLCGDEFIDIYQYEKFKYSRQLYKNIDLLQL